MWSQAERAKRVALRHGPTFVRNLRVDAIRRMQDAEDAETQRRLDAHREAQERAAHIAREAQEQRRRDEAVAQRRLHELRAAQAVVEREHRERQLLVERLEAQARRRNLFEASPRTRAQRERARAYLVMRKKGTWEPKPAASAAAGSLEDDVSVGGLLSAGFSKFKKLSPPKGPGLPRCPSAPARHVMSLVSSTLLVWPVAATVRGASSLTCLLCMCSAQGVDTPLTHAPQATAFRAAWPGGG